MYVYHRSCAHCHRYGFVNFMNAEAPRTAAAELTIDVDGTYVSIALTKKKGGVEVSPSLTLVGSALSAQRLRWDLVLI